MSHISLALRLPHRLTSGTPLMFVANDQKRAQGTVFEAYIGGLKADGKDSDTLRAHIRAIYEPVLLARAHASLRGSVRATGDLILNGRSGSSGASDEHDLSANWIGKVQEHNAMKGQSQKIIKL